MKIILCCRSWKETCAICRIISWRETSSLTSDVSRTHSLVAAHTMNIPWRRRSSVVSQLLTVYTLYAGRPAVRGNPSALCAGCATAEYICDVRHPVYKYRTIYVLVSLLPLTTQLIQLRHAAEEQEYATIYTGSGANSSLWAEPMRVVTGQLADATGDFACLVFVLFAASARPRVVQLPCELNPCRPHDPRRLNTAACTRAANDAGRRKLTQKPSNSSSSSKTQTWLTTHCNSLHSLTATVSHMITGYINITPFAKLNTLHTYKQKTVEQYDRVRPRIIIDTESQKR